MTAVAVGSPRTKTKSSSSLPSSASTPSSPSAGFRFGDFDIEIDVKTGAPADQAGSLGAISADSNRAYQRALSQKSGPGCDSPPNEATLSIDQSGKEGRTSHLTPPHKTSSHSPGSQRKRPDPARGSAGLTSWIREFESGGKTATWSAEARSFYKIDSEQRRADKRDYRAPHLDEHARLAIARTQLASTEMQLRVESRRFEVAQVQLQVQAERTATAKAQLAVEKTRRQIRQLDIELELKQADSATAKSAAAADRDAARLLDLDKQMALAEAKKANTELQLDVQQARALSDADLQWEQQQTARAYIGLQTARLRNQQNKGAAAEVDTALIHLGVLPSLEAEWQCAFDCGFATADQTELEQHQAAHYESTEHPGFFRSWNTGKWECDANCGFDAKAGKFDEAAAKTHILKCTYRHGGEVMYCSYCEEPMSVPLKDRRHTDHTGYVHYYHWKPPSACAECTAAVSESGEEADTGVETAEAAVQVNIGVRRNRRGKSAGQKEGHDDA
jgi:hypothetical protein